jgi:hypothetical protein
MNTWDDRRVQPRVRYEGAATVAINTRRLTLRARDLSEGGLGLEGTWFAYPGQRVTIAFELAGHRVDVWGRVAWADSARTGYVWGVEFTTLHPASRNRISAFIRELAARNAANDPFALVDDVCPERAEQRTRLETFDPTRPGTLSDFEPPIDPAFITGFGPQRDATFASGPVRPVDAATQQMRLVPIDTIVTDPLSGEPGDDDAGARPGEQATIAPASKPDEEE